MKDPHDMSIDELKLLLEIRRLELMSSVQDVKHRLGIGARILRAVTQSGILDKVAEAIQGRGANVRSSDNRDQGYEQANTNNKSSRTHNQPDPEL